MKIQKIASLILCLVMMFSLCACGRNSELFEHRDMLASKPDAEGIQEPVDTIPDTAPEEDSGNTLQDLVSITDVTLEPIDAYSASVDCYDPRKGYVIEMTVSNENDVSCDIYPQFTMFVTDQDNYGAPRTTWVQLLDTGSITTPYGPDMYNFDNRYLDPVGLAPHETKTVRYYIVGEGVYELNVFVLDGDDLHGETQISLRHITSITDIQLCGFKVEEAEQVYLPADQWGENIWTEEEDKSNTGLTIFHSYVMGTVENNTEDRWESVSIKLDISVNGQTFYESVRQKTYQTFHYVDIGDTVGYLDSVGDGLRIASYEKQAYQVEAVPALLAYTPDPAK